MTLGEKIAVSALLLTFGPMPLAIGYGLMHPKARTASAQEQALTSCGLDEVGVQVVGVKAVEAKLRAQLRSPSTATFSGDESRYKVMGGCTIEIVGWVDAQNGFGATTRFNWIAHVYGSGRDLKVSDAQVLE